MGQVLSRKKENSYTSSLKNEVIYIWLLSYDLFKTRYAVDIGTFKR